MATAIELFSDHLNSIATDLDRWRSLYAPDAIYELPYAPSISAQERFEGIQAITSHIAGVMSRLQDLRFKNIVFHSLEDPNSAFAEFDVEALVKASGVKYEQKYVCYLKAKDGKIVLFREYFNPVVILRAFRAAQADVNTG